METINPKQLIIYYFLFFLPGILLSQTTPIEIQNIPLEQEYLNPYEKFINNPHASTHTAVKPYLNSPEISNIADSIRHSLNLSILKDSSSKKFSFRLDALLNLKGGYDIQSKDKLFESWIAPRISGSYSDKLYFSAVALWSFSDYPAYIDSSIQKTQMVPGIGIAHKNKKGNYSSEDYFGYISYSPNKIFNLQAGKGKHFWGDGHRSLFLSDFAPSYPYFKINTQVWKINYVVMYSAFQDAVNSTFKSNIKNKYGTFHYLSWNISKRLNIGLFESIVWQGADSNRFRGFDANYLNPIIFFRPVEYSLGSSDNAFLGFSFKIKAFKKQVFYGQLILDEFLLKEVKARRGWWANKQGVQAGFRSFDLFTLKNLDLRTEVNYVRPYTYSHGSVQQNYGHLNHPLAHPLGANFMEGLATINYRYKKWSLTIEGLNAIYGADSSGINMGQNIFESYVTRPREFNNYTTQGIKTNLTITDIKIAYSIVPEMLNLEAGFFMRRQHSTIDTQTSYYFSLGIRTPFLNEYRDF